MIEIVIPINGWKVQPIVEFGERVGYDGEVNAYKLVFTGGEAGEIYKLDVMNDFGAKDVLNVVNTGGTLSVALDESVTLPVGIYQAQLRTVYGETGDTIRKTNIFHLIVDVAINAVSAFPPLTPSEFEQQEAALSEIVAEGQRIVEEGAGAATEAAAEASGSASSAGASAASASSAATLAAGSAASAQSDAESALASKRSAQGAMEDAVVAKNQSVSAKNEAETSKNQAVSAASSASSAATLASTYAADASASATDAAYSSQAADGSAETALNAKNAAEFAKTGAVDAKNGAVEAKNAAQTAKTDAETAKSAAQSAATDASTYSAAAQTAKTAAEAAQSGAEAAKTGAMSAASSASSAATLAAGSATAAGESELAAEASAQRAEAAAELVEGKADKVDGAVAGNVASLDADGNLADSGVPADKIALIDGSYITLDSGTAHNLIDDKATGSDQDPFFFRPTAGDGISISGESSAQIKSIRGKTFVWNQLASNSNTSSWNVQNVSLSLNSGEFILTSTTDDVRQKIVYIPLEKGHKYFGRLDVAAGTANCRGGFFDSNNTPIEVSEYVSEEIYTHWDSPVVSISTDGCYFGFRVPNDSVVGVTAKAKNLNLFDLTVMYGAGNEPSSVSAFRNLFGGFYDYSAPLLLNFTGTGIKSVGFNQLDLDSYMSTLGIAKTGGFYTETAHGFFQKSNNVPFPIKWLPNTAYCFYIRGYCSQDLSNFRLVIRYADGSFQEIRLSSKSIDSVYGVSDPVETIREVVFSYGSGGGGYFYLDSLCVSFSHSGYRNGEYEPYWSETRNFPVAQYFPTGMKYVGSVYDELTPDKAITRIGAVDLGELNWSYSVSSAFFATDDLIGTIKEPTRNDELSAIRCIAYAPTSYVGRSNKTIHVIWSASPLHGQLRIIDSDYTDAASFKSAMSGVIIYYELATPTEVPISPPLNLSYRVEDFGTEELLPVNGSEPTTSPLVMKARYNRDYTRQLDNIMDNIGDGKTTAAIVGAIEDADKTKIPTFGQDDDGHDIIKASRLPIAAVQQVVEFFPIPADLPAGRYYLVATIAAGSDPVISWEVIE